MTNGPTQRMSTHTSDELYVRDKALVGEMMGVMTFTDAMIYHILGREPSALDRAVIDAALVTLMEHGMTPSAIATRLTYHSAPEALQAAVAGGLLNVGSAFVGTMENNAMLLREMTTSDEGVEAAALRIAKDHKERRKHMPGFGHHLHRPDDPRTPKLFEIAENAGCEGTYISALKTLGKAVDEVAGKHITINATGGVSALLSEIGVAPEVMRGFAVISRAAGLVAHISDEQRQGTARKIWDVVEHAVPYEGAAPVNGGH